MHSIKSVSAEMVFSVITRNPSLLYWPKLFGVVFFRFYSGLSHSNCSSITETNTEKHPDCCRCDIFFSLLALAVIIIAVFQL